MAEKTQVKKILKKKKPQQKQKKGKKREKTNDEAPTENKYRLTLNTVLLIIIVFSILLFLIMNITSVLKLYDNTINPSNSSESEQTTSANPPDAVAQSAPQSDTTSQTNDGTANTPQLELETDLPEDTDEENEAELEEPQVKTTSIILYYIKIMESGEPQLMKETRTIPRTPAILTATVKELLKGSENTALANYIPSGSQLLHASISDGIAKLDFNDVFQFNEYGNAGILAQLYQVVYTATEIPTIKSVQITINGEQIEYLGGEGTISISKPLTKSYLDSF